MSDKIRDLELWKTWKRNPTPMNMQTLLDHLNPLIQKEVNRWSGGLSRSALEIEAKRLAAEAIKSFSPVGGASLATHVTNRLQKLSRMVYTHQNIARMPEYQTLKIQSYTMAHDTLRDRLGRDPTVDELSEELGWSKAHLANFQKMMRKEYIESAAAPPIFDERSDDGGLVDFVFHDLPPIQKQIFQHTTGYGGAPILKNPELAKKLKLTQGQLSYQKRLLVNKMEEVLKGKR